MDQENINGGERIVTADKPEGTTLLDVQIFQFDENFIKEKVYKQKANIENFDWILTDVTIFENKIQFLRKDYENFKITSIYNLDKMLIFLIILILCLLLI